MAMLHSQEHCDMIEMFERDTTFKGRRRFDKEDKSLWPKGVIYQDGSTNELFLAYRSGYAYGKTKAALAP